jgi:acyl carrier protein
MTDAEILQRVARIVADVLGLDGLVLTKATTAPDVEGWDSLANMQIIVAIEKAFGIRFRTGEIASMKNVGALVTRVGERIVDRRPE